MRLTPCFKSSQLVTCSIKIDAMQEEFSVLSSTLQTWMKKGRSCGGTYVIIKTLQSLVPSLG